MNRREFIGSVSAGVIGVSRALPVAGQGRAMAPDLAAMADEGRLVLVNRTATRLVDGTRTAVRLSRALGETVAFLPDLQFANGTIGLDIRGANLKQQSFVGVAFHGVDGSTFDCVFFRPFNFKAADPVSRGHAIQYHSLPDYRWDRLRKERPGEYEQPVDPAPDPNTWFRVRIVVADSTVNVFVADATRSCLTIRKLNSRTTGLVGLWVGNYSGGDFANLDIAPT